MSANPISPLTAEEYLAIDRKAEIRSEFYDGVLYAMAGGSRAHAVIAMNFASELRAGLKGRPCYIFNSDARLRVSTGRAYSYPDVAVVCGPAGYVNDEDTVSDPTVLVEVLSPSTESFDRGFKFARYRKLESLQEYVLVSSAEARVECFRRQADQRWVMTEYLGLDSSAVLESIGCQVKLAEIYDKVELPAPPD